MSLNSLTMMFNKFIISTNNNIDRISRKRLTELYKETKGSTKGVTNFIALFKNEITISGLKYFSGYKIKEFTEPVEPINPVESVEPVNPVNPVEPVEVIRFAQTIARLTPVISDYEQMSLLLKNQKLQQQIKIEQEKMAQLANFKKLELEMEEKKLMTNVELSKEKMTQEVELKKLELAMEEKKLISK